MEVPHLSICCSGKEENSTVDDLILQHSLNTNSTTGFTPCLAVTFVNKPVNSTNVVLEFVAVPCVNNITTTICEVRVYEQVIPS